MKKWRKALIVLTFVLPAIIGFAGYIWAGNGLIDSMYLAVRMYLVEADTINNNILIELARWAAPIVTVSGLSIILKNAIAKVKDFFVGFSSDAIAVYGDTELKEIVRKNIRHTISVDDNEVMDVSSHIIMFSTDEKGLEFYKKNKEKFRGEVFIKIDKNDSYNVALDQVKFFNPCELIARDFWQKNDIRQVIGNDDMKIAIVGSDILSRKILTYGLLNNIYSLTQRIEYHIWSNDDFFEKAHKDFKTDNDDKIEFCDNKCPDRLFQIASADRIIITEPLDNEFMSELAKLTKGEVYCFDPMGTFVDIFKPANVYPFGRFDEVLTAENIRTDKLYEFAKKLNYQYALKYLEQEAEQPTMEEAWDEIDAFTKGSNVASTDYHRIRLIVMKETGKKDVDDTLAEMEHIRWCRYHYLNHWRYGETKNGKKDSENKIHPCLKDFAELEKENQEKDLDGIKTLLSLEGIR